jgi:hypothetical protein
MTRLLGGLAMAVALLAPARAQVIEFESNGLKYQTLTRSGVTVMWAHLPLELHDYNVIQVAVSNGSGGPYVIRPEDFSFVRTDGKTIKASPAGRVVNMFYRKGSGSDVVKLVTAYESSVYRMPNNFKSTNGYEQRRQGALAMTSTKVKAAATASALALVQTKLLPGDSTDGAVFFPSERKPMGQGYLVVRTNTDVFHFGTN